jgi:DNA-binding NarL/FixJ family response regulator
MIRILIADDHPLYREGLTRVLNEMAGLSVVASVSNGVEAVSRGVEFKPDVVLMDVNMPKLGGIEATAQLHKIYPQIAVLMLTISENEHDLFAAIRAGARGYLLKNATSAELIDAIQRVFEKEAILSPGMAAKLLDEFAALSRAAQPDENKNQVSEPESTVLTAREREVLDWVAQGMTNKEIGTQLSLSPHTVKAHVRTILEKLHLHTRAEAAVWASKHSTQNQ